ncbi:MAG: pyrroline-5-carboxylate reductase [Pseudomonadota bacterium]
MDIKNLKIGIIGGGVMAENILRGILRADLLAADHITVSDVRAERLSYLKDTFKVKTLLDNVDLASKSDIIIIAVKPQSMKGLLDEIKSVINEKKLILSIAAGVKAKTIADGLQGKGRIIRSMPNIAAKVLESASVLSIGPAATGEDLIVAKKIFDAIGKTVVINEDLMDAVTGLSGSGPAYFFLIIEALADGGVKAGLPRAVALKLAAQTCFGAAKLVLETDEHPAVLKDQVTSPGGTTIAGIEMLEKGALRGMLMNAVAAAVDRSKELGKG